MEFKEEPSALESPISHLGNSPLSENKESRQFEISPSGSQSVPSALFNERQLEVVKRIVPPVDIDESPDCAITEPSELDEAYREIDRFVELTTYLSNLLDPRSPEKLSKLINDGHIHDPFFIRLNGIISEVQRRTSQMNQMYDLEKMIQYTNNPELPETIMDITYSIVAACYEMFRQMVETKCVDGFKISAGQNKDYYNWIKDQHRNKMNDNGPRLTALTQIYYSTASQLPSLNRELRFIYHSSYTFNEFAAKFPELIGDKKNLLVFSGVNLEFFPGNKELLLFIQGKPIRQFIKSFSLYFPVAFHFAYRRSKFTDLYGVPQRENCKKRTDYLTTYSQIYKGNLKKQRLRPYFKIILWMSICGEAKIPYVSNENSWECEVVYPEGQYTYVNHRFVTIQEKILIRNEYNNIETPVIDVCVLLIQVKFEINEREYKLPSEHKLSICMKNLYAKYLRDVRYVRLNKSKYSILSGLRSSKKNPKQPIFADNKRKGIPTKRNKTGVVKSATIPYIYRKGKSPSKFLGPVAYSALGIGTLVTQDDDGTLTSGLTGGNTRARVNRLRKSRTMKKIKSRI
jgi:hypothetical protein